MVNLVSRLRAAGARMTRRVSAVLVGGFSVMLAIGSAHALVTSAPRFQSIDGPTYTNADSITVIANFDSSVVNVDASDFEITGTSATITGFTALSALRYQIVISGGDLADLNGEVYIDLAASQDIENTLGVPLTDLTPEYGRYPVTVNNTQLQGVFASTATAPVSDTFRVTMSFLNDESYADVVVGLDGSDLVVTNGTVSNFQITANNPNAAQFDVTPTATGTVRIELPADTYFDDSSNANLASTPFEIEADMDPPEIVSITRSSPSSEQTNLSSLTWNIQFSKPISGMNLSSFEVTGSTASANNFGRVGSADDLFFVQVGGGDLGQPDFVGTVGLELSASHSIRDGANRALTNGVPTGANETYDVSRRVPVLSDIRRFDPAGERTNADSVTWDFAFSSISPGFDLSADDLVLQGTTGSLTVERYSIGFYVTASGGDMADLDALVSVYLDSAEVYDEYGNRLRSANPTGAYVNTYRLDNTAPTVELSAGMPAVPGGPFYVTIEVSENYDSFDADDIVVGNGSVTSFEPYANPRFVDIQVTPDGDGLVTVDVPAGVLNDEAGNPNTAAEQVSVRSDATPPTITSVEFVTTGGSPTNSDTLTWAMTVSEPVLRFDQYDFYINGIGYPTVTNPQPTLYVLEFSGGPVASYNGTLTLQATNFFNLIDEARLPMASTAVVGGGAAEWSVTLDNTAPGASITTASSTVSGAFTADITPFENILEFEASDVTVTNGTITGITRNGNTVSVTVQPSAEGAVLIQMLPGSFSDLAGNLNTATPSLSVQFDQTPPTPVSIQRFDPSTETTNADSISWRVDFSEAVGEVDAADFVFAGAAADLSVLPYRDPGPMGMAAGQSQGAERRSEFGIAYLVTASGQDVPEHDGVVTLSISDSNDIVDAAGLALSGTTPSGTNENSFTLANDVTGPTPTLSSAATEPVTSAFSLSVDFDENVIGLTLADFVVSNAQLSDLAGSDAAFTVTVTPTADGTITIDLPADAVTDAAGNGSSAADFSIEADITAPTLVLASSDGDPVAGAFTISLTFSESVTGLELGDLAVGNGAASDLAGGGAAYTALITPQADGAVTIDVAAGAAEDGAGLTSQAADTLSVVNDETGPVATFSSDVTLPVTGAFTLLISFDEPVTGFELADLAVTSASLSDFAGSDDAYSVTVTPGDGAQLTVDLAENLVVDAVGNGNQAAETFSLVLDNTPPTLAIDVPGATVEGAFTATLRFSEDVSGFDQSDIAASNADLSAFTAVSAQEFTVLVTPQTLGTVTLSVAADAAADAAGNGNEAASAEVEAVSSPIEVTVDVGQDVQDPTDVTASASISNPGSQPVAFRVEVDVPWLDVDPSSGTIPSLGELELTITVNDFVNALEAGTYTGTITVINLDGDAIAKGDNAVSRAEGDSIVVSIPLTVTIAERRGTIQLVATTPGGLQRDATFGFASSDPDLDGLSLTTVNGQAASSPVRKLLGQYDVTQSLPQGWRLDAISCVGDLDNGSVIDPQAGRVDIDLDANEDIVCTFENVRDEAEIRLATQRAIRNFMIRRADRILDAAPDLTRRLRDRDTRSPGSFAADINGGSRLASVSTSLSGMRNHALAQAPQMTGPDARSAADSADGVDVWLSARYSALSDDRDGGGTDSAFGIVQLGADWAVGDDTLVGALIQHDWMDEETDEIAVAAGGLRGARVGGSGWMAGPYVVRELTEGVWLDVIALYGRSTNTVDPLGLYEDTFETQRYLLRANLSGEWQSGAWRIRPSASLAHFEESQDAYVDSLGIDIPEQVIVIGRLEAGPELAYRITRADGGWWEPAVSLSGVWDYNPAELLNDAGQLVGTGDVRLDARLSLNGQLAPGATIGLEADVAGLGDGDFEARSARIQLRLSFN